MFSFFSEFAAAQKLASQRFHVIFFSEGKAYHQYLRHLYEALLQVPGIRIAYITAGKDDPVLQDRRVEAVYLKTTLAGIFPRLRADVMIMTMPDLQNFIFKKSPSVKKYVYVFHALVSTHQQYRKGAFDHYDAIFCTGPQQEEEIRESEKMYSLPAKEVLHYGYPLLDDLKKKSAKSPVQKQKVLIAPSWYNGGIFDTCIKPLLKELSNSKYEVWVRPHPEFVKRYKKAFAEIVKQSQKATNIHFDTEPDVYTHLSDAAHLITDRSGIALEYAFATQQPVLFMDTPLKIQNTDVGKYSLEPVENKYRSHLGVSIQPNETERILEALSQLETNAGTFQKSILEAEAAIAFARANHQNGFDYIINQLS